MFSRESKINSQRDAVQNAKALAAKKETERKEKGKMRKETAAEEEDQAVKDPLMVLDKDRQKNLEKAKRKHREKIVARAKADATTKAKAKATLKINDLPGDPIFNGAASDAVRSTRTSITVSHSLTLPKTLSIASQTGAPRRQILSMMTEVSGSRAMITKEKAAAAAAAAAEDLE
ncbi:MAG: hypothetical protein Q9204_001287 [Flavoplaca sp. TL-2023a]